MKGFVIFLLLDFGYNFPNININSKSFATYGCCHPCFIYIHHYLAIYLPINLANIYLSIYIHVTFHISIHLPIFIYIYLSIHLFKYLCIYFKISRNLSLKIIMQLSNRDKSRNINCKIDNCSFSELLIKPFDWLKNYLF